MKKKLTVKSLLFYWLFSIVSIKTHGGKSGGVKEKKNKHHREIQASATSNCAMAWPRQEESSDALHNVT